MRKQPPKRDFNFFIDEYFSYCQSRRLRHKTMQSYEQTLRLFERWTREHEGKESPLEVKEATIHKYICEIQERGKYSFYADADRTNTNRPDRRRDFRDTVSTTTINNYLRNLRAFFNWLYEDRPEKRNPMRKIRLLENDRKPKEYLDDQEVRKLLYHLDTSYFPENRDRTVITLILDSGMRIGECLQLRLEHLNMKERAIEIPADITKGRKARRVFFSGKTARTLHSWMQFKDRYIDSDYLFPVKATGEPVEVSTFETNFRRYVCRAGIEKSVSPHALRNNFAKRCLLAGMDIYTLSRILGHSSVTVTEKAYLDLTDQDLKHRYDNFSPIENLK
ncbi:MAG: tyrosine-type recombinase/integrase [Oscillospiraceae bacterium]|nr:tyrosine-type recombinase/integrase [Oscillospiraceae bacterium]